MFHVYHDTVIGASEEASMAFGASELRFLSLELMLQHLNSCLNPTPLRTREAERRRSAALLAHNTPTATCAHAWTPLVLHGEA